MTARERYRIWKQYDRYQITVEQRWVEPCRRAILQQIKPFIAHMKEHGIESAVFQLNVLVVGAPIERLLKRLYEKEGIRYANIVYGSIQDRHKAELAQEKAFGLNQTWLEGVIQFLINYGGRKVTHITETTRDFIRKIVEEGIAQGKGVYEISKDLLGSEINVSRSKLIARTETNTALNYANEIATQKSGLLMEDTWLSADDSRVRYSHRRVDGEVVIHGERFSNGLRYPGDPEGRAEEVINCRCTKTQEAKRDASGRLIKIPVIR